MTDSGRSADEPHGEDDRQTGQCEPDGGRRDGDPGEYRDDLHDQPFDDTPDPDAVRRFEVFQVSARGGYEPPPDQPRPTISAMIEFVPRHEQRPPHALLDFAGIEDDTGVVLAMGHVPMPDPANPDLAWLDCVVIDDPGGDTLRIRLGQGYISEAGKTEFEVHRAQVFR